MTAKKKEVQNAIDPFEINHVSGVTQITAGHYDFWSDAPTVFALSPLNEDGLPHHSHFTVCLPGTGAKKRVLVPLDCAMAVEIADDASWQLFPIQVSVDLDKTPVEVPLGMGRPLTIEQQIQRFVSTALSMRAERGGKETIQDSEDFDVDDEPEWSSRYELQDDDFMPMVKDASPPKKVAGGKEPEKDEVDPSGSKPTRKDNKSKALDTSEDD